MPLVPSPYIFVSGCISLPLPASSFSQLPALIDHGSISLQKESEFRAILISVEEIILTIGATTDIRHKDIEEIVFNLFKKFVEQTPLAIQSFSDDVRFAVDREKQSILVRCVVPHLEEFFAQVNKIYGTTIPVLPPHVILYTLPPNGAISITSEKQMESFARVQIPSIDRVIQSIVLG